MIVQHGDAELLKADPLAHAFAPQFGKGRVVRHAAMLDQGHNGLDEIAAPVTPAVVFGQALLHRAQAAMVVHAQE